MHPDSALTQSAQPAHTEQYFDARDDEEPFKTAALNFYGLQSTLQEFQMMCLINKLKKWKILI